MRRRSCAPKGKDEESYEEAKDEPEEELDQAGQGVQGDGDEAEGSPADQYREGGDPWEYDWAQLTEEQKAAASLLGFEESTWDKGEEAPVWRKKWHKLGQEQRDAATLLGWDEARWDEGESWSTFRLCMQNI